MPASGRSTGEEATVVDVRVRGMTQSDLFEVARVTNAAFGALFGRSDDTAEPLFADLLFLSRYLGDPSGCLLAEVDGIIAGCLLACTRGTLGWIGPLAVRPEHQRLGVGDALVAECVEGWKSRGVTLSGLETFADSKFHVGFYGKFGFRPSWTGLSFERILGETAMPADVEVGGALPDFDFLYQGLDISAEADAATRTGAGVVVSNDSGAAIIHLEPTFQPKGTGFIPFAAASSAKSFDLLIDAAEHLAREHGCTAMSARAPGSSWATHDRLRARGYRIGSLMVRMKSGGNLDYDRGECLYLDNWL